MLALSSKPTSEDTLKMYRASRNWLIPYLLLILRELTLHGYDLITRLANFGITTVDQGTIYRTLRQLEKDGHVQSSWENNGSGPARRVYSITNTGIELLRTWFETMGFYQNLANNFMEYYQATLSGMAYKPKPWCDSNSQEQAKDDEGLGLKE